MSGLNRPLFFAFSTRYLSLILDLVLVVIISRVLTPDMLGIFSIAAGSIAVGHMLREFGLSLYLIKEKELTDEKIQGCFTISILLCWTLGFTYLLAAGAIGEFYNREEATTVVQILSINFFMLPFSTLIITLYNRKMEFGRTMVILVVGTLVRVIATIILLYLYTDITSVAWGSVIGTACNLLFALYYREWRYYRFNFTFVKEIIAFSSYVSLANILNQLSEILPEAIIGKFQSTEQVAYYAKGTATINLFNTLVLAAIGSVIKPYIARLNNNDTDMRDSIYSIYNSLLVLQWPFCAGLLLFADDLIAVLYGSQWGSVVELTHVLAFFMIFEGIVMLSDQLLSIMGHVKYYFKVMLAVTVTKVILVFMYVEDGLLSVVIAVSILSLVKVAIILPRLFSVFQLSIRPLVKVYVTNGALTLVFFTIGYAIKYIFQDFELLTRFFVNGTLLVGLWVVLVFLFKHQLRLKILEIFQFIGKRVARQ